MGFFDSLANGAGKTLGNNLMGGTKVQIKEKKDVKGESKIADAQAKANIKQAEGEAKAQIKLAEGMAKQEAKQATLEAVNSMRFDGTADEMSENLNALFSMLKQMGETAGSAIGLGNMFGKFGGAMKSDVDKIRDAIKEKSEFGLMKLRKQDPDSADFFQKKYDEAFNK